MIPSRADLAARLGRLADTLADLKARVADAVAAETGIGGESRAT